MRKQVNFLREIRTYFSQKPEVVAVYLYGSFARGEAKTDSDIDLGVLMNKVKTKKPFDIPQVIFSQELSQILGKEVEVQDLSVCSLEFAHRVLSEGKLIFSGNDQKRIEFVMTTIKKYFDLKPMYDEYDEKLLEIAKKGELNVRYT